MTRSGQLVVMVLSCLSGPGVGQASILEDVLLRIDQLGHSPLSAIMVNLASNVATPMETPATLAPGALVVVGYDQDGVPVSLQAGESGVTVPPELAASMATGLQAGLYPVGSQLYELPPAGQLSLYAQSRDGEALSQAQALLMSRVDGSITTVIRGVLLPDLAPAQLASVYNPHREADLLRLDQIRSTTLGAVNTGEILTNVTAKWQTDALAPDLDLGLAEVSLGTSSLISQAMTDTASASHLSSRELGGIGGAALVLNLASNEMAIAGQITTIVQSQSVRIDEILTTAIGAINAGAINPAP